MCLTSSSQIAFAFIASDFTIYYFHKGYDSQLTFQEPLTTGPEVVEMRPAESFLMVCRSLLFPSFFRGSSPWRFQSGKLEVISNRPSKDCSHHVVEVQEYEFPSNAKNMGLGSDSLAILGGRSLVAV
ncbi:hypothetical protein AKJ16_DCAP07458 [Drosera capensis]